LQSPHSPDGEMMTRKVVIITNVVFERYGNQSVRNFIEGLLLHGCEVVFITAHPGEDEQMKTFMKQHRNFTVNYLRKSQSKPSIVTTYSWQDRLGRHLRDLVKRIFTYRRYSSNSGVLQWLSLLNTLTTLRLLVNHFRNHRECLSGCDRYIFIDVFGGLSAHYLRLAYPSFWAEIAPRSVGYYLGTVLKQFKGRKTFAFIVMPLSFIGSYKVLHDKLIVTDDGTDGENVFRSMLGYRKPILFIRNGIDNRLASFEPPSRARQDDTFRFVTCSRLTSWKRVDRAIRFVYHVKALTSKDIHLTIIGEGEEQSSLKALVCSLDLSDTVTFAGPLEYQVALQRIAENDFYIVFNDLSNMGNQIHESIVLGLIPLTIDDGSTDSLLRNGIDSLKFPMTDNFEADAARVFVAEMTDGDWHAFHQNLMIARQHVLTWRQRNQFEYEFIFGACPDEVR
jgi:glycosyltransferase involved in cell wall biosynthesis